MCVEFKRSYLVGEFAAFGQEENVNRADMVLGGIGMADFLTDTRLDGECLVGGDACGAFQYGYMLFSLPIARLNLLA